MKLIVLVIQYHFLFRGTTSSVVQPAKRCGMAEEQCSDNAFVPETQMDPVDYIDISSDVNDMDTIPERQIDLDSETLTKSSDRY